VWYNLTPVGVRNSLDVSGMCSTEAQAVPGRAAYELVAVANHFGSRSEGHYIAHCRSAVDGLWYWFDDTNVTCRVHSEGPSTHAYVLFHRQVDWR